MFVGEEQELVPFTELMEPLLSTWNAEALPNNVLSIDHTTSNEGIVTAGKVQICGTKVVISSIMDLLMLVL